MQGVECASALGKALDERRSGERAGAFFETRSGLKKGNKSVDKAVFEYIIAVRCYFLPCKGGRAL